MNYWLVKFAPFRNSWEDILKTGKFEIYSVRNPQARNSLKEMKFGDEVLFYQSQVGKSVMGKMRVIEEAHQDKTTNDKRWVSVTFEPVETFRKPVSLIKIRQHPELCNISLIMQPRLSVVKLSEIEYSIIENPNSFN